MTSKKTQDVETPTDGEDLQALGGHRTEDQKDTLSLTDKKLSVITNKKKFWYLFKISDLVKYSLILFATYYIFRSLNAQYFEMNQVCPYKTDFDCLYRYLICEGDCSDISRPLAPNWLDFAVETRRDGFYFKTRLAELVSKLVLISFVFSIILALGIFKKGARIYILLIAINVYYLRTYRDGDAHGDYTKILGDWLIILVSGFASLYALAIVIGRLNSKGKGYASAVFTTIILFILFALYGLARRFTGSCDNWDKGLYGERIDNSVNCQFSKPGFCIYEFIGDFYDYNKWLMYTCDDRKPHWDLMTEKYPNASRVGFPLTKDMTKQDRDFLTVVRYVENHTQEVTQENEKDFEVILHRTWDVSTNSYRGPAWIDINIQFNQELVAQRSNLVSESVVNNVMVLYIDTLSRAAAFRRLPETMKIFEKMTPKMHQFFKYHSITPYTIGNMYPMFYGVQRPPVVDESAPELKSFISDYKNKGFITGRASSHCALSAINTVYDHLAYEKIDEAPFDHEGIGWSCDVNARPHTINEVSTGPLSVMKRCVYGKEVSEYVMEYGKKFWETYKDQKKFLWLDFLDFHEHSFNHGKYLDKHLSQFLSEMDLSDTLLMMISDHGHHLFLNHALYTFRSGHIERAAPTFFVKLPENLESVYGDGIEKNKQQILTAFDLHKLFKAIPNPEQIGDTLFYPIPAKTTGCDFTLKDQECQCKLPDSPVN